MTATTRPSLTAGIRSLATVRSAAVLLLLAASALSTPWTTAEAMPFAQWPELQKGHAPDSVFMIDDLESVNLLNGNLTLTIPLGQSYPVSSSLSYGLTLVYNSNPWEALEDSLHQCNASSAGGSSGVAKFYPKTLDRLSNAGVGWMINLGRFQPPGWQYFDVKKPDHVYVAPDGSRHGLHPELHYQGPEPVEPNGIYHTRDGSFLRLIENASCSASGDCRRLEMPDGSYQEFHHVGAEEGDYRPTLISDAFGNRVAIEYSAHRWTITDDHGRAHRVDFDTSTPAYGYSKVVSVTLGAFGGNEAVYEFHYSNPVSIERHQYADTLANASCTGTITTRPGHPLLGPMVEDVEFLERIVLPDRSYYEMTYDDEDGTNSLLVDGLVSGEKSGAIHHLRLASGLHFRWQYNFYYGRLNPLSDPRGIARPVERVFGVARKQRFVLDENGLEQDVVTWEYNHSKADIRGLEDPPPTSQNPFLPCYSQTDVRFFRVDRRVDTVTPPLRHSRHYFSSAQNGPGSTSFKNRKSLPLTPCPPDGGGVYYNDPSTPWYNDGLFLSQETLDPADPEGPPIRSIWVDYETDAPDYVDDKDGDRRLIRRRTVFHDDGDRWIETRNEDFDGLGNFRRQVRRSSFEGTAGDKTELTAYNMTADGGAPSGPHFTPGPGSRWLLGLYTETCSHQGSGFGGCDDAQQRTLYDFDPETAFLRAKRQLRGSQPAGTDILSTYGDTDGDGNPDSETLYGGDPLYSSEPQLPPESSFAPGGAPVDHRVEHTYTYGVRSRSVIYDGSAPLLETLDLTIDRNTGLASRSRDAAGLETVLDFDRMGRLTRAEVKKNGQFANVATRLYRYTVATEDDPDLTFPSVIDFCKTGSCRKTPLGLAFEVRDCPPGTSEYNACHGKQLGERRYFYDRQGRKVDERRLIPWTGDGQPCHAEGEDTCKEVLRKSAWDLADRKIWETEWHATGHEFRVFYTTYPEYDLLDRPLAIERPDTKRTTLAYRGERLTTRTLGVWTGGGETAASTVEQRDGFGRLVRVTEPAGENGADVDTTYRYDHADRLVLACVADGNADPLDGCTGQERRFTYDGSGLMTEEAHPEIEGTVRFTYDARGNVLKKDLSGTAHDLKYVYDAAGRAVEVYDGDGYLFQESFYGRANDGPRRAGKLYQTRRHNRLSESPGSDTLVDHVVTETYDYSAPGDRLAGYSVRSSRGASFTTRYTYDTLGSLTSVDYPDCDRAPCADLAGGPTLAMRNVLGRVVEIPGWLDKVRYRPRGSLSRIEHINGVTDEIQRHFTIWKPIEKIRIVRSDGAVLWDTGSYEYDGAGNIYRIGSGAGQESFTYDLVSRLRSATVATAFGTATESQTYDVYGNIKRITRSGEDAARELSPSAATNRLPASLASYDAGGNLTSWAEGGRTYSYEYGPDNRVTTLEGSLGQSRAFLYTASGERFAVFDYATGKETYTPRGPGDGLLSRFERSAAGWQRTKDYVRVDGKAVATVADGVVRHLHQDHLGSTRLITDAAGDIVGERTTFFPFGTYAYNGTPNAEEHRFTGHERDEVGLATASLDYMHARYYASSIGRFLSVDPVLGDAARPQSWNRYTYVYNNPIALVDEDGREGVPPPYIFVPGEGYVADRGAAQVLKGGGRVGAAPQGFRLLRPLAGPAAAVVADAVLFPGSTSRSADDVATPPSSVPESNSGLTSVEDYQLHHSDPKFMGGDPDQQLTVMSTPQHQQLHRDMNDFLSQKRDSMGNHMRPQRGNSGARIRGNFTRHERLQAMAEFYRQYEDTYPDAARDFFEQHPDY